MKLTAVVLLLLLMGSVGCGKSDKVTGPTPGAADPWAPWGQAVDTSEHLR